MMTYFAVLSAFVFFGAFCGWMGYLLGRLPDDPPACPGIDTRAEDYCAWKAEWDRTHPYPPAEGDAFDAGYRRAWKRARGGQALRLAGAAGLLPDPEERHKASDALDEVVREYLDGYEFRGDGGDHTPTELEAGLIADAVAGLIGEDEFVRCLHAWDALRTRPAGVKPSVPGEYGDLEALDREVDAIRAADAGVTASDRRTE